MKSNMGKIILAVVVIYFIVMGIKNINKQKDAYKDIIDQVTIVADGKVKEENDGKIVLVKGKISYDGTIEFPELDYEFNSFKVKRDVQDYVCEVDENGKKHYSWVDRTVKREGEGNLDKAVSEIRTLDLSVGEFEMNKQGMDKINDLKFYMDKNMKIEDMEFDGLYYSILEREDNPKVGDMRVSYHYYNTDDNKYISVLAVQKGKSFEAIKINGQEIYEVYSDEVDTKEKLQEKFGKQVKTNSKGKFLFILLILGVGIFFIVDSKKK